MPDQVPLINGKSYSWGMIEFIVAGVVISGITAISYGDEQEKENGYGAGNMPIDRGNGNYTPKPVSMSLKAYENEKLIAVAPNGRIQDLGVFDIIVQYLDGVIRKKHTIRNNEFTGNSRDLKQGDKNIEVEHTTVCSHVDWK